MNYGRRFAPIFMTLFVFAIISVTGLPGWQVPGAEAVGDISGTIMLEGVPPTALQGVTVNLGAGLPSPGASAPASTTTDAGGFYQFLAAEDGDYVVTPVLNFHTFYPASQNVTVAGGAVTAVDFLASAALPGGTLDPTTIPKFVTPLVIPPVMHDAGTANTYDIAVRQFKQQILPGGIWNVVNGRTDAFPATTVWSYGPESDPMPDASGLGIPSGIAPAANSQFNYPSYTIETTSSTPAAVRWRNELVADPITCNGLPKPTNSPACNHLPHLLTVDQTLHWANPPAAGCTTGSPNRTDCRTLNNTPYTGPVPIVTHVHGAHVDPHSDGYPEAWWLPAANDIPVGYTTEGTLFDDAKGQTRGRNLGYADYLYRNDQPATTLWYHDHSLGMTRLNVYAGPAGFWLLRGGAHDLGSGLPGPAPVAGQGVLALNIPADTVRQSIREIPIAIQDRSFNSDGSLFYPDTRAFFDTYPGPYTGSSPVSTDIAPFWNPEAFFNTMVVNGVTWPTFEVAPALYRLRLLNGCNSRFLNLALFEVDTATGNITPAEHFFYQIGAEQGFLPKVVKIKTGYAEVLPGDGTNPGVSGPVSAPEQALLMGLAERADVLVDFRGLEGKTIRMINTAPDSPFGGFGDPPADPGTTGQVMQFVVNAALNGMSQTDPAGSTPAANPWDLVLPAETALGAPAVTRDVSLNEEESGQVCVTVDAFGNITVVLVLPNPTDPANITSICGALGAVPQAPKAALVGTVDKSVPGAPLGIPLMWTDMTPASTPVSVTLANGGILSIPVTENPHITGAGAPIEDWNIYNFTADAHPIHLHLVRFQVLDRRPIPGVAIPPTPFAQQPWETGFKDTVIAYPNEITTVRARFDIPGLYVWHCHIVEHEDNEMMRPYVVSEDGACGSANGQAFLTVPSLNLCSSGTASGISGSGPWTWTCIASQGGSNSSQCSANIGYTVTANAAGNGTGTVSSNVGGIAYSYPAVSTQVSSTIGKGTSVVLTANAGAGATAAWTTCTGGVSANNGTSSATCTYSSLNGYVTSGQAVATFTLNKYTVRANAAGTGTGTVVSNTGGISYTYPAVSTQTSLGINVGTSVVLTATATTGSTVAWTACTGGATGGDNVAATCTYSSLAGNVTSGQAVATFTEYYVREANPVPAFPYMNIADAYAAAVDGALIEAKSVQALPSVTFGAAYAVTVTGGYNGDFSAVTGMTTLASPVSFEGGAVTIANIVIQ